MHFHLIQNSELTSNIFLMDCVFNNNKYVCREVNPTTHITSKWQIDGCTQNDKKKLIDQNVS